MAGVKDFPKIFAANIQWDTDGEEVNLPDKMEIPKRIWEKGDVDDISDWISNETGFCHGGFSIESDMTRKGMEERVSEIEHELSTRVCTFAMAMEAERRALKTALELVDDSSEKVLEHEI